MVKELPKLPYTTKQVAEMYGLKQGFVISEIAAGRLPARHKRGQTKCWYITDADLEVWANTMLEE